VKRIQTPYLRLCSNCGMHGKIIFPDGSESKTFLIYEEAIEILRVAHIEGRLTYEECCMLRDQLKSSDIIRIKDLRREFKKILKNEIEFFEFVKEKFKKCEEEEFDFMMN